MGKLTNLIEAVGVTQKEINEIIAKSSTEHTSKEDKFKELKEVEKILNKQFDTTGSIMLLGGKVNKPIPSISTHLPSLDWDAIQCGGIPRGRIIEIFGPESAGKTTLALHIIACEQQDTNNLCAFVDAEHSLDPTYASKLGVNVNELLISQPDSGEQALETVEALIERKLASIIVVDSVAALVPRAELEGDMGDAVMGSQARLMSQAMRKLRGKASMNGITVIFLNQIREKLGVMFGSPEVTTGGRALKFFSSLRLDVRKRDLIGGKENPLGHKIEIKCVKNKVGTPFRSTFVDLLYGIGLDYWTDFIEHAVKNGAVEKSVKGGYYSFGEKKIGQGLTEVTNCVKVDTELKKAIDKKLEEIRKSNVL